jgi:hypothetical protein
MAKTLTISESGLQNVILMVIPPSEPAKGLSFLVIGSPLSGPYRSPPCGALHLLTLVYSSCFVPPQTKTGDELSPI